MENSKILLKHAIKALSETTIKPKYTKHKKRMTSEKSEAIRFFFLLMRYAMRCFVRAGISNIDSC